MLLVHFDPLPHSIRFYKCALHKATPTSPHSTSMASLPHTMQSMIKRCIRVIIVILVQILKIGAKIED